MWHARITFRNHFNNRLNFLLSSCFLFFCLLQLSPKSPGNLARGQSSKRISFARCLVKKKKHTHERRRKERKTALALIGERSSHSFALPCSLASPWFRVIGSTFVQWRILNSSSLNYTTMDVQCSTHIDLHLDIGTHGFAVLKRARVSHAVYARYV